MEGISVIIPVYNEEKSIRKVIEEIKKHLANYTHEIIAIDDGSTDQSREILKTLDVATIFHPINRGYGQTLLSGIEKAVHEYIVTIDADDSYAPADIPKLIAEIPRFDLVIGQRTGRQFWGSLVKHPARLVFLWLAEFTVGHKIPDVNSGLRVFKKSSFDRVNFPILCRGFSFSSTMTLSFLANGAFVSFIPIQYLAREGKSKVNYFRDIFRTLQTLVEVVTYYNPLKLTILLCAPPAVLSLLFVVLFLMNGSPWNALFSLLMFSLAFIVFVSGLVIDSIRLKRL